MGLLRKSSGRTMLMPTNTARISKVATKAAINVKAIDGTSAFYAALQLDYAQQFFDTATMQQVGDTSEQTVIDTGTGQSGVLTQIKSPSLTAAGDITIRVTIDGSLTVFAGTVSGTGSFAEILCVGDFAKWAAQTSAANAVGYGGGSSFGYSDLTVQELTMLSPADTAAKGLPIGMIFRDSMKITVQGSVSFSSGSSANKAAAAWLTYIPEGL